MPKKRRFTKKEIFKPIKTQKVFVRPRTEIVSEATSSDESISNPADNTIQNPAPESSTVSNTNTSNTSNMEPFIGQIIMFGGNFAPRGWALCDGQLLPISQNTALFSILGTMYGGDGRTTFGLPDLRGRIAMHAGNGPSLSDRRLGNSGGSETNTLNLSQIPPHSHNTIISEAEGETLQGNANSVQTQNTNSTNNLEVASEISGGGQPVNNIQPFQVVNFIIAVQGIFPSRS